MSKLFTMDNYTPGTVVFLNEFPCGSASFGVAIKAEAWLNMASKESRFYVDLYHEYQDMIPIRILGCRLGRLRKKCDLTEPYADTGSIKYYCNNFNHIEICNLDEVHSWCWRLKRFGPEIDKTYFSDVVCELKFLREYLNGELKLDKNNDLEVEIWNRDWNFLFHIYEEAIPVSHYN